MAAMLDMAFQLLTFFVLTWRPAAAEGQIQLRMPPPEALVGGKLYAGKVETGELPKGVDTLVITIAPTNRGNIAFLRLSKVTKSEQHIDIGPDAKVDPKRMKEDRPLALAHRAWEKAQKAYEEKAKSGGSPEEVRKLQEEARDAGEQYEQARMLVGLEDHLVPIISLETNPYAQVLVQVGDTLKYEGLMKVVDRWTRIVDKSKKTDEEKKKLMKLTFVAAPAGPTESTPKPSDTPPKPPS